MANAGVIGRELGLHEHTVGKWRRRFLKDRCDGLLDEGRPGISLFPVRVPSSRCTRIESR
jgi:Homeodomain-like domain